MPNRLQDGIHTLFLIYGIELSQSVFSLLSLVSSLASVFLFLLRKFFASEPRR